MSIVLFQETIGMEIRWQSFRYKTALTKSERRHYIGERVEIFEPVERVKTIYKKRLTIAHVYMSTVYYGRLAEMADFFERNAPANPKN